MYKIMEDIFQKTKNRLTISIMIFSILFVGLLFLHFIIIKKIKDNVVLRQELEILKKEDIITLKRAIRNYETHSDVINNFILDKNKAFVFIEEIETLAKESNLNSSVQSVELLNVLTSGKTAPSPLSEKDKEKRSHGQLDMKIGVTGEWDDVSSFLIKLENIPKRIIIKEVRFSSVFDGETKNSKWTVLFNILAMTN